MNDKTDKDVIFNSSPQDAKYGLIFLFFFFIFVMYASYNAKDSADNINIVRGYSFLLIMIPYFIYRAYIGAKPVVSITRSGLTVHKRSNRSIPWSKIKSVEVCSNRSLLYNPNYIKVGVDKAYWIGSHNNLPEDQISYCKVEKPSIATSTDEVYYAILANWERYRDEP